MAAWFDGLSTGMQFFLFWVVGHLGVAAHFVKLYCRSETSESIFDYYFRSNIRATAVTYMAFSGAMIVLMLQSTTDFKALLVMAFETGYLVDSVLNRGAETPAPQATTPSEEA